MMQTLIQPCPGCSLDTDRQQSQSRHCREADWGPQWSSEPLGCRVQPSRKFSVSPRAYRAARQSNSPMHLSCMVDPDSKQCLCRHCRESDWGPQWPSDPVHCRAQPSRNNRASRRAYRPVRLLQNSHNKATPLFAGTEMNLQEAGWTPDHPEETALAGSNRAGKRPAARTPSSKDKESPVQASQERPPPTKGEESPQGTGRGPQQC